MNREQKRAMQKAGHIDAEGAPVRERRDPQAAARARGERVGPRQYLSEVRSEMRKVAWPTRAETMRLSLIVFVCILVLGLFIFLADLGFGQVTDFLFPSPNATGSVLHAVSLLL